MTVDPTLALVAARRAAADTQLNLDLIAEHYDDRLRLAGSPKFGHATASLLVGKLSASGRQNALAAALKEYGALRRTIYAAKYLSDPDYRRTISRQFNQGESLHALRRGPLYAHEGMIGARHLESQTEQAWWLTLATNAVIAWTAECYGLAVEQMRREGRRIDDEVLAHVSPAPGDPGPGGIEPNGRLSPNGSSRPLPVPATGDEAGWTGRPSLVDADDAAHEVGGNNLGPGIAEYAR